jgi:hypothetical protein
MSESETKMYADVLFGRVDQLIDSLQGLSPEEINMRPPVPESNSLLVLAVHTMANVKENLLEVIGGNPVGRDRDSEFRATGGSSEQVLKDWTALRAKLGEFLEGVDTAMLDREYEHVRRGRMTGRKVLLTATSHASEHVGHAELTRDWIVSQRT